MTGPARLHRGDLRLRLVGLLALGLSACGAIGEPPLPTLLPPEALPTVIAQTLQAAASPPAATLSPSAPTQSGPSATPAPPSATPTITPTPSPTVPPSPPPPVPLEAVPEAAIQIYKIGDLSKVTSPIRVSGFLNRGSVGPMLVELRGEDGRVLARLVRDYEAHPTSWTSYAFDLDFEIAAVAEVGRLIISTQDEFGRTKALNSVELILLSQGNNDFNPPTAFYQSLILQEPAPKTLLVGGNVVVSGFARVRSDGPLMAQLIAEDGRILGIRLIQPERLTGQDYGAFVGEVPYQVSALTTARLVIYETGERISEMAHLVSTEVLLGP